MVTTRKLAETVRMLAVVGCLGVLATGCDFIRDVIASVSDGASCVQDGTCLGGTCLGEEEGFPGGYCTTTSCETAGCSNIFGAECLSVETLEDSACFRSCEENANCRAGYACLSVDTRRICLPTGATSRYPEAGSVGTACSFSVQCTSGTCLTTFLGGYCSVLDCAEDGCPDRSRCTALPDAEDPEGAAQQLCMRTCTENADCRFGYRCESPDGGDSVCVEAPRDEQDAVRNPGGLVDGSPCTTGLNCRGGTCLREVEGYPGGYCTTLDCSTVGCTAEGALCRSLTEDTACFARCNTPSDCRSGYVCVLGESESGFCSPNIDGEEPIDVTPPVDPQPGPSPLAGDLTASCTTASVTGGRAIDVEIASGVIAFTVVPYVTTGQLRPRRILRPDGSVAADFTGNYGFQAVNAEILRTITPVSFPAAPQFGETLPPGTWRVEVATTASEVCWYPVRKLEEGRVIDLNFYLVGVPGLTPSTAANHTALQGAMTTLRRIFARAAVDVREVRYLSLSSDDTERFRIIRNFNEVFALAGQSATPGPSRAERLSVNVFLIQGFAVPQSPGLLGLSLGIPGVPGTHGNVGAGLVFTSEYLSRDPSGIGQTLAHEIGHFLGLRHTSEHGGTSWDPLEDTPQCSNPERGSRCPDAANFMFPFSLSGVTQENVSAGQAFVLRRAALTQ